MLREGLSDNRTAMMTFIDRTPSHKALSRTMEELMQRPGDRNEFGQYKNRMTQAEVTVTYTLEF